MSHFKSQYVDHKRIDEKKCHGIQSSVHDTSGFRTFYINHMNYINIECIYTNLIRICLVKMTTNNKSDIAVEILEIHQLHTTCSKLTKDNDNNEIINNH